jgi:hypothetical protein
VGTKFPPLVSLFGSCSTHRLFHLPVYLQRLPRPSCPPSRADRPGDSRSNISSRCTSLSVGRFFAFQYLKGKALKGRPGGAVRFGGAVWWYGAVSGTGSGAVISTVALCGAKPNSLTPLSEGTAPAC